MASAAAAAAVAAHVRIAHALEKPVGLTACCRSVETSSTLWQACIESKPDPDTKRGRDKCRKHLVLAVTRNTLNNTGPLCGALDERINKNGQVLEKLGTITSFPKLSKRVHFFAVRSSRAFKFYQHIIIACVYICAKFHGH